MLKISFLLILLANLVFLLWEFQQGAFSKNEPSAIDNRSDHRILLTDEIIDKAPIQTARQLDQSASFPDSLDPKTVDTPLNAETNNLDATQKTVVLAQTKATPESSLQQAKIDQEEGNSHLAGTKPTTPILAQSESTQQLPEKPNNKIRFREPADDSIAQEADGKNQLSDAKHHFLKQKVAASGISTPEQPASPPKPIETSKNNHSDSLAVSIVTPCFEQQTFKTKKAAKKWLLQQHVAGNIREIEKSVPSSYLVYIPAAENYQQAKLTVKDLMEKDIEDFWLFRKGPMKNAISLGLFVKQYRAEKLANQLQEKGIEVKTEVRFKPAKRWLVTPDADVSDCVAPEPEKYPAQPNR